MSKISATGKVNLGFVVQVQKCPVFYYLSVVPDAGSVLEGSWFYLQQKSKKIENAFCVKKIV